MTPSVMKQAQQVRPVYKENAAWQMFVWCHLVVILNNYNLIVAVTVQSTVFITVLFIIS